ncbi:MAG: hypothetical protein PVG66_03125 [Chromatiales bacterium]|jgi:hypothetical protein
MAKTTLFSIIESPAHPPFSALYRSLGIEEQRFTAMRKAISALKKVRPDFVVAEFFYGYGNNYAGVNVSNLDVFLHSLQKYAPQAKVVVLVTRQEAEYVDKLAQLFRLHQVLVHPVSAEDMKNALSVG